MHGLYFCRSGGNESAKKKLVAFPPHLQGSQKSLNATWKLPFTVDCPYNIGVLCEQYTMVWTVIGTGGAQTDTSKSSDYQLVGSSLIISSFTPFIVRLICTLTVSGTQDFLFFQVQEVRSLSFYPVTIESGNGQATIIQAPNDTRASDSGTAGFECVASVPQNCEVEFEMFGETITTNDISGTTH